MGLSAAGGTLADKYLLVNTASGPGAGIVNQTIQFHGTANLHTLKWCNQSCDPLFNLIGSYIQSGCHDY